MIIIYTVIGLLCLFKITNVISYDVMKKKILLRQKWDLNICCGKTDGGGLNVDIVKYKEVQNFIKVDDVYNLPFGDKEFRSVLSSHTIEHLDDPKAFINELNRVGEDIHIILPPLWDFTAAFNVLEHKWLFLTLKKEHKKLPYHIRLPLALFIQEKFGQRIHA